MFVFLSFDMAQPPEFLLIAMPEALMSGQMRRCIQQSIQLALIFLALAHNSSYSIARRICSHLIRSTGRRRAGEPGVRCFDRRGFIGNH